MNHAEEDLAAACDHERGSGERHAAYHRYEISRWCDAIMLLHQYGDRLMRLKLEDLDSDIRLGVEVEYQRRIIGSLPPPPFGVHPEYRVP